MNKRIMAFMTGVMLMVATSAMALPTLSTGYSWVNAPFWTNTDKTTGPANGNSQFALTFENASYESDFGLFTITGTTQNPEAVRSTFQIFSYTENEFLMKTVIFRDDGSISLDGINFTAFDKVFGFYFGVHAGGSNDSTADYTYYSYNPFNAPSSQAGSDHIVTAYNGLTHEVMIFLDDQLIGKGYSSDRDFDDMKVYGNDLTPVPEPGTMMLLGIGLLGLAIYGKRRMNKEA